jgi:hypothetical protein
VYSAYAITVHAVAITNNANHPGRLNDFKIKVGNIDPARKEGNPLCYGPVSSVPAGKTAAFPCIVPRNGKYVVVRVFGNNRILSISELVVYGDRAFGK